MYELLPESMEEFLKAIMQVFLEGISAGFFQGSILKEISRHDSIFNENLRTIAEQITIGIAEKYVKENLEVF